MEVLDTSIANVALPHIAGALSAGQDESTWVLTSYLVANAIILPMSGWFSSLIGRKRFYMTCVAMFTISSLLCGLAPSLGWLIVFRILQGLGGGGLQPSEQAILADTFEPKKRGMAFALYGIAVVTAPALGPTLGGWITDNFDWRWIFFINIPVGILSIFLTSQVVEDPPHLKQQKTKVGRIDFIGFGLIALGLGALQIILDKGERDDWFNSPFIIGFTIVAVLSIVIAVFWELRQKIPIVDLRLLRERNFAMANVMMFALGFVLLGSTVLLPLMLQTLMGYTATEAGMAFHRGHRHHPDPAVRRHGSPRGAGEVDDYGWPGDQRDRADLDVAFLARHLVRACGARSVVQASGIAFLFVPINTIAYAYLPKNKNNDASGLVNLSRNIGGSVGIAFATTLVARRAQVHQSVLSEHASNLNPQYLQTLASLKGTLVAHGMSLVDAAQQRRP